LLKTSEFIVAVVVAAAGGLSTIVDLRTRRVPNPLTLGIALTGVGLAAAGVTRVSVVGALMAFAIGFALMLPGHLFGATGAGDVKLLAALGTFLGPAGTVAAFLYTAVAGGLLAVATAACRRSLRATVGRTTALVLSGGANASEIEGPSVDNRFAYAPAIAIGAMVAVLWPLSRG
jgi:prepilin peptidase CpaA